MNLIKDHYYEFRAVTLRHGWEQPTEELVIRIRGDACVDDVVEEINRFLRAQFGIGGRLEFVEKTEEDRGVDNEA